MKNCVQNFATKLNVTWPRQIFQISILTTLGFKKESLRNPINLRVGLARQIEFMKFENFLWSKIS